MSKNKKKSPIHDLSQRIGDFINTIDPEVQGHIVDLTDAV